jgi:hypothetical protein
VLMIVIWSLPLAALGTIFTMLRAISTLRRGAQVTVAGELVPSLQPAGGNDILIGALWLVGGLAVTAGSFSMAHGAGGGRYVVTTGAIAYGLVRLFRGLAGSSAGNR